MLKESLVALRVENVKMESALEEARDRVSTLEASLAEERQAREAAERRLSDLEWENAQMQSEFASLRARHEELVAIKAQFDPQLLEAARFVGSLCI